MASWQDELARILAELRVVPEESRETPSASMAGASSDPECSTLDFTTFQTSRTHYGTFYRVDLIGTCPVLRVLVPVDEGPHKFRIYLVQFREDSFLVPLFTLQPALYRSLAFEAERETLQYRVFLAYIETLKQLFWKGDLDALQFPAEILVTRLL